jgi:hypothetical protein
VLSVKPTHPSSGPPPNYTVIQKSVPRRPGTRAGCGRARAVCAGRLPPPLCRCAVGPVFGVVVPFGWCGPVSRRPVAVCPRSGCCPRRAALPLVRFVVCSFFSGLRPFSLFFAVWWRRAPRASAACGGCSWRPAPRPPPGRLVAGCYACLVAVVRWPWRVGCWFCVVVLASFLCVGCMHRFK